MRIQPVSIVLFLSLTAFSAGAARAEPASDVRQARVAYGDLDLTTAQGARTLWSRVRSAAREVCWDGSGDIVRNREARLCEDEAMRRAADAVAASRGLEAARLVDQNGQ